MDLFLSEKVNAEQIEATVTGFFSEVISGLSATPKKLSSKYFYDKIGDNLFQQIMALPEYYLTACELDIFQNKTANLANILLQGSKSFDLIELGAGDGTKSAHLLRFLSKQNTDFTYIPIDISGNILSVLDHKIKREIPGLKVQCLQGEYFEMLRKAAMLSDRPKVVMFLGSNIGNMELEVAGHFCQQLKDNLHSGDIVMIGFDLKKHPQTILNAYNDSAGITAAFNLNLLRRINRELGADFNINNFQHFQNYDPVTGACRSYLISLVHQSVTINGKAIDFAQNEYIDMEISQKFSRQDIQKLAFRSGFHPIGEIADSKDWFVDAVWKVN